MAIGTNRFCRKCGKELWPGERCRDCQQTWRERRIAAYAQAKSEIGELSPETHQALIKRVHELEKE